MAIALFISDIDIASVFLNKHVKIYICTSVFVNSMDISVILLDMKIKNNRSEFMQMVKF